MGTIEFKIPLEPTAKGRPRMSMVHGRPIAFTPKETRIAEAVMKQYAIEAMQKQNDGRPLEGVLNVWAWFYLRRPKSVRRAYPTTKPDLDNYIKTMDAFNGVVWMDDSQVVGIFARKLYTDVEQPRMEFIIEEIFSAEGNNHKKTTIKGKGVKNGIEIS